ncbi:MAG TPA: ParA family protein [Arcobacter sp.]|nr:ParA family protein [Arcobacter sp.]
MIIIVSHTKGGVGKSTISFNLATALNSKYNIEVIDLDFQKTLTYLNEYRKEPLIVKNFDNDDEFKKYITKDSDQRISIIDVGGFDSTRNRIAMIMADLIITPVSDSSTELLGLMKFEKILKEMSEIAEEDIPVKILLNNINPQKKDLEDLKKFIAKTPLFSLLKSTTPTRAAYDKALGKGLGILEYKPDAKAGLEMQKLIHEIEVIIKEKING